MGIFLNPGNTGFMTAVQSEIYVDKTELIRFMNQVLGTERRFVCVSRPRRFGKSITARMLAAYYSKGCDSQAIFKDLNISAAPSFAEQLNHYDVIYIDVQWFRSVAKGKGSADHTVSYMQKTILRELREQYPDFVYEDDDFLPEVLARVYSRTKTPFIIIVDEWDCLFREDKDNFRLQDEYINFLRGMFKGQPAEEALCLAYITGILPIKKYGTQSALNNFDEYTMIAPNPLAKYVGFTESEVRDLCEKYQMDFEKTRHWYDGYSFPQVNSVYAPNSVVHAMRNGELAAYWTQTETYEDLKRYIGMDFDGLKESIIHMLGGIRCKINTRTFQNDITNIQSKDDVLTLLVHLGYLAYDSSRSEVYIPNQEVADEFRNAVECSNWKGVSEALKASEKLLEATLRADAPAVAAGIDEVHLANTSILTYNNELSLSCVITIAYYVARKDYILIRELPSGKGFADIAFVPLPYTDKPALLIELKWDNSAQGAIKQIKEKRYEGILKKYTDKILLVGINYNRQNKRHECVIERY